MSKTQPVQVAVPSFDRLAADVIAELHASLASLFASFAEPINRAVEVERTLGLEKTVAWQFFRLSQSADLAEAANIPSRTSVRRMLTAARRRHAPKALTDRFAAAFEQFETFVAEHGGDRDDLLSMISPLTGDKSSQYDLKVRKGLFRGNSHVWGLQARMSVQTHISVLRPAPPSEAGSSAFLEDLVAFGSYLGLVRRQTDPLTMLWYIKTHESLYAGRPAVSETTEPIHYYPLELIPEFCSRPLPEMRPKLGRDGTPQIELVFPQGRAGAVSLYWSQFRDGIPNKGEAYRSKTMFTMPQETMVKELLFPVGWTDPATARAAVYGYRYDPEQGRHEQVADLLPQRESLDYLGAHECVPPLAGEPNHVNAVRHVLQKRGWLGMRFDVYRCRVEYPVMHTVLAMRVDTIPK